MTNSLDITKRRILIKHTAAIHSSSKLTHTQKILFNHFLFNAFKTIADDKYHSLSYEDVYKILGWSNDSNINEWLKEELAGLTKQNVQWNIFRKDKKQEWVSSACLADVRIKDGKVYYSFSKFLREVFSIPNLYAKIDLDTQVKLGCKEALSLWEYFVELLDTKSTNRISTDWIEWTKIAALLSGSGSSYLDNYALFKLRVLKKALVQIAAQTDLVVTFKEKKEGRSIKFLSFYIERNNHQLRNDSPICSVKAMPKPEADPLRDRMLQFVSATTAKSLLSKYEHATIENALDFCEREFKVRGENINNPVAFLKKAIEEGWMLPHALQERMDTSNKTDTSIADKINSLIEAEISKAIRLDLWKTLGNDCYQSWFQNTTFTINADILNIYAPGAFFINWIKAHYGTSLTKVAKHHLPGISVTYSSDPKLA